MKINIPALLSIFIGTLGFAVLLYSHQDWTYILLGILLGVIAFFIAFFMLILKDKTPKRVSYLIIIAIGLFFLILGVQS